MLQWNFPYLDIVDSEMALPIGQQFFKSRCLMLPFSKNLSEPNIIKYLITVKFIPSIGGHLMIKVISSKNPLPYVKNYWRSETQIWTSLLYYVERDTFFLPLGHMYNIKGRHMPQCCNATNKNLQNWSDSLKLWIIQKVKLPKVYDLNIETSFLYRAFFFSTSEVHW